MRVFAVFASVSPTAPGFEQHQTSPWLRSQMTSIVTHHAPHAACGQMRHFNYCALAGWRCAPGGCAHSVVLLSSPLCCRDQTPGDLSGIEPRGSLWDQTRGISLGPAHHRQRQKEPFCVSRAHGFTQSRVVMWPCGRLTAPPPSLTHIIHSLTHSLTPVYCGNLLLSSIMSKTRHI